MTVSVRSVMVKVVRIPWGLEDSMRVEDGVDCRNDDGTRDRR